MNWGEAIAPAFWVRLGLALGCGGLVGQVVGVTSAAVMWILAAIGAAVALDQAGAAIAITAATVGILIGLNALERAFVALRRGVHADGNTDETVRQAAERRPS